MSGGRVITGWQRVAGTAGTWAATLPPGFDTRQLYANGRSLPQAAGLPASTAFVQTPDGFLATSTAIDSWPDPSNIAVLFTFGNGPWTQTSCNIASISGLHIVMAEPCWDNLHLPSEGVQELGWVVDPMGGFPGLSPKKMPSSFENAYALMTPGTWTIDRVTQKLYYMPAAGQSPTDQTVVAPALQSLLRITGTLEHPVTDVIVRGITVEYGGWTGPDSADGFAQMQADWRLTGPGASSSEGTCQYSSPPGSCPFASWTRTPANVVLSATHGVSLLGDTFTHLGGAGLDVMYGSQDDLVQGNEFTDIAASAVQLGSTDDPEPADVGAGADEIDSGNVVTDNYIHDVANEYLGGVGIWLGYTQRSTISHNQIDQVPYTAISVGWGGWHTHLTTPDSDPNVNSANVIADNLLYDYMTTLGDGGAVYTNGPQAQGWADELKVTGNVAYLGPNTDFGLYTDTGSEYVDIEDNFLYYQPFDSFDSGGCQTIGHIVFAYNVVSSGGPAYPCFPYTDVTTANNTTVCEDPPPAQAPTTTLESAGLEPRYRSLLDRDGPTVTMVGPRDVALGGDQVLISGSGFDPGSSVSFGGTPATTVTVVSGNYILATAPPGSGTVDVTVSTPHGSSPASSADQVTYQADPSPCVDYTGSGFTTALFSS